MIKLMTMNEVTELTRLSKATIYRLLAANKFPPPKRLTTSKLLWPESEIEKWIMEN